MNRKIVWIGVVLAVLLGLVVLRGIVAVDETKDQNTMSGVKMQDQDKMTGKK
jgi:hypothetical protein